MRKHLVPWLGGLLLSLTACSGSVEIDGYDDSLEEGLAEGSSSGNLAAAGCVACSGAGCGFCDELDDQLTFRCPSSASPYDPTCRSTGSLFADQGSYYTCWHCDL